MTEASLVKLADLGMNTLTLLRNVAGNRDEFVVFLKDALGFDPSARIADYLEISKLVGVWNRSNISEDVLVKQQADRAASHLPPQLAPHEHLDAKEMWERDVGSELEESLTPGKAYFERLIHQSDTSFQAESLTTVVSMDQEAQAGLPDRGFDPTSGLFRVSTKTVSAALPKTAEELRMRLKLLGHGYVFLKRRCPNRLVL